jgi:hypothetical protein
MNRSNACLFFFAFAALAAATYVASCHCGDPNPSPPPLASRGGAGGLGGQTVPPLGARTAEKVPPLGARGGEGELGDGLATHASRLTASASSDTDFLTANRGYGIVEDTSVSAGNIRRTLGLPNFGLANANPTVTGWQTTTAFATARSSFSSVAHRGYLYVMGGAPGGPAYTNGVQYAPVNADGTFGAWSGTAAFTTARANHSSVAHNGYLYIIGGYNFQMSQNFNDVQYASVNSDGTVNAWMATMSFATPRRDHAVVAYNGYMYVLGGYDGSQSMNDVQVAKINADGTVGAWTPTSSFATGRYAHASVAYNGYIYVLGGYTGTGLKNDVQVAQINADGTIGVWTATEPFSGNRNAFACVPHNGYLYVLGGDTGSGDGSNDVQYAPVNSDGTLGVWNTTTAFGTARRYHRSVAVNGFLYVLGGCPLDTNSPYNDVQFAPIRPDGHVGTTWVKTTDLPAKRYIHTNVVYNGFIYQIGGYDKSSAKNEVLYAPIFADGTIGTWTATSSFTTARTCHSSFVYKGRIYIIGGNSGGCGTSGLLSDVQFAPVNPDGTVGAWTSTTGLGAVRQSHQSVAYDGYVYVSGGYRCCNPNGLADVVLSKINSDGTLGSWTSTSSFSPGRYDHTMLAFRGKMYLVAGLEPGGVAGSDVLYANINPSDGTLGTWTTTTGVTTARRGHTSVIQNGYVYVVGGSTPSNPTTSIEAAPINTDGTVGPWSFTTNLPVAIWLHGSVLSNGYLYVVGGQNASGDAIKDVQFAPINANGTVGEWKQTTSLLPARDDHVSVIYNGYMYSIGGWDAVGAIKTVAVAPVNPDGTIGTWAATTELPLALNNLAAAASNGYLYAVGGHDGGNSHNEVWYAPILAGGNVGTWTATSSFVTPRHGHKVAVYNGRMYLLGGVDTANPFNDVQYATINADGTLGSWTPTTGFTTLRQQHGVVVHDGRIYVIGGGDGSVVLDTVEYATVNNDGSVGTWASTTSFATPRYYHMTVADNGFVYVLGGRNALSSYYADLQFAPVNPNGTLGVWTAGVQYPSAVMMAGSAVTQGNLFVAGGASNGSNRLEYVRSTPVTAYSASTKSSFSKQFDLGTVQTVGSFTVKGVLGGQNSKISAKYRTAGVDGVYGVWSTQTDLTSLPGTVTLSSVTGRYIEIALTIDDNGRLGVTSGMGSSEVSEIAVGYGLSNGSVCAGDGDCASNLCVSLVCCNSTCDSPNQCQTAGSCATGTCVYGNKDNTVSCDDGNICTHTDKCNGAGGCAGTSYTCTVGQCDLTSVCDGAGGCTKTYKQNTVSCNDSNPCTHTDKCDGAGGCAGTAYSCVSPGACETAVGATCNGDGTCTYPADTGADCNDGNACTHTDKCQANKTCAGTSYTCTAGQCDLTSVCDGAGGCTKTFKDNTVLCDDANACTHTDKCDGSGGCAGTAYTCTAGQCDLTSVCDGSGGCTRTYKDNTVSCDDANACTHADKCNGAGGCAGTPYMCNSPGACETATGAACNGDGTCAYPPNTGAACDDSDACTHSDKCRADKSCAGTAYTCTAGQCDVTSVCDGAGGCTKTYKDNTVSCDDTNACTHTDKCNGAGGCAGTAYSCVTPGACETAVGATCNGDGTCAYPADTGADCNDGNACTHTDKCQADKSCAGTAYACASPGTCETATGATCNGDGTCAYPADPGASCSDGNSCSHTDLCQADKSCVGTAYSCPAPTQCQQSVTCNGAGGCTVTNKQSFELCNDGDDCTTGDHCDGQGNCVGGINTCADAGTQDTGTQDTGILDAGEDAGADGGTKDEGTMDDGAQDTGEDAGTTDAGADGGPTTEDGGDTGTDTGADSGFDSGADVSYPSDASDGSVDTGPDAGTDAGPDAAMPGKRDAGAKDAGAVAKDAGLEELPFGCVCSAVSVE